MILTRSPLDVAVSTAHWLATTAQPIGDTVQWPLDPARPERVDDTLFNGNAGTALFLLQLAQVTDDAQTWDLTRRAAESVFQHVDEARRALPLPIPRIDDTLYLGRPGLAFALVHLGAALDVPRYHDAAERIFNDLLTTAQSSEHGLFWSGESGILADGGTALALIEAGRILSRKGWIDAGLDAIRHIEQQGTPDLRGGLAWDALDPSILDAPPGTRWPNFEFGTAGIGFVLARAYEVSGQQHFLLSALRAAEHLRAIATRDDGAALIHYREPDLTDLFYLGNCHGPVGTSRLFILLRRITSDPQHLDFLEELFAGVSRAGAPRHHSPGYWQSTTACCGTAAFVNWGVGLYAATGDARFLEFADRSGEQLLGEVFVADEGPARWYDAFTRTKPTRVDARTSLLTGSAGSALALLHLHLAHQGQLPTLRLPDDPWPVTSRSAA